MVYISSWIISILVVVLFGVLVEVILPNGKLSKIIKCVIATLTMLVIISPIKNIDLHNLNFQNYFQEIVIDNNFINERNEEQISYIEKNIEDNLEKNGYLQVSVKIDGNYSSSGINIKYIYVDLGRLVISQESQNINKYNNIMGIIKSIVEVEEGQVIFYE